ncbi:MAG: DUF4136 domain-containing protein [Cyclobacteriaceae bacterium]
MKRVFYLMFAVFFLFGCNKYYSHVIEADYSYDGNFNRYKTYDFAINANFDGTEFHKELIEKYLAQNLSSWGYKRKIKKPNLVIFYSLYTEDLRFQGYDQPSFENWLKWNFPNGIVAESESEDSVFNVSDYLKDNNSSSARGNANYASKKYQLKEGTLLISLYDRRMDKTIWQGYASGVIGNEQFDNDRFIRHIVMRIMDKYRVLAVGTI